MIALIGVLFGSVLVVGAAALNLSENLSGNNQETQSLTESDFKTIEDGLGPSTDLIIEKIQNNGTIDEPGNELTPIKPQRELKDVVESNKGKFNDETKEYLQSAENKKESRKYIVKFKKSVDQTQLVNFDLKDKIQRFKLAKIEGKPEDLQNLIEDSEIEMIELDQNVEVLGDIVPYNVMKTKSNSVWNLTDGSGVKIAVLDTGIAEHEDLLIAGGVSFVSADFSDSNGHGTAVAGVISAVLNGEGLAGVAPDAEIYSVKIMNGSSGSLSDAISGIEWAIENNMDIVSMSFGIESYSQIFKEVLEDAYNNDIVLVAASGNEGTGNILYPAKYDSVIAVGATDSGDNLASFSSYGLEQELVGPGAEINSTSLSNGYLVSSGTSFAAPHVAGVAALIKSYNNSLTNAEIRNKLRNDALDLGDSGKDDFFGYGLVQANFETNDFTSFNDSYFYEIFNITDYGLENVSYNFWISGTGTIDDVEFEDGYYLANLSYQNGNNNSLILNVSENGSVVLIVIIDIFVEHQDDFQAEGTDDDRIVWVNGKYSTRITGNNPPNAIGVCYEEGGFNNPYDFCFFKSSADRNTCDSAESNINCGGGTNCNTQANYTVNVGSSWHNYLDTTTAKTLTFSSRVWYDISGCSSAQNIGPDGIPITTYVVDKKRVTCLNSSDYKIEGHYGNGNWIQLGNQFTCGSGYLCVNQNVNYTNPLAIIEGNPCIAENTCIGNVQVIAEDSRGNPLANLLVTRDDVSNKTTNLVGVADYNLTKNCGQSMEFVVRCDDNVTFCDAKTTSLDFMGDYDSLMYDCTRCNGKQDLKVNIGGVNISPSSNKVNVNFTIENVGTVSNLNVTVKAQDKNTGLISNENYGIININQLDTSKSVTISINLANADFVHVYIDADKIPKVNEPKINNYVAVPVITKKVKAFVSVDTGFPEVDKVIKDYIHLFVIPTAQSVADIKIVVSVKDRNQLIKNEGPENKNKKWFVDDKSIYFNGNTIGSLPYTGIVSTEDCFLCTYDTIFAVGTDIDGTVAAVKRLINTRVRYLKKLDSSIEPSVIEKKDVLGISVYDIMHNAENKNNYRKNNPKFANVVTKILTDNNFEVAIKTVKTYNDNTTLRLKNVNSDFSQNFKEASIDNPIPVVLAGGAFTDLFRWEAGADNAFTLRTIPGLAVLLTQDGRDVWEIEITGGPTTDSDCLPEGAYSCKNYNYTDLVDYYWPALIAGVEKYSGQNTLQYVGHSTGCRVALDSLKNWSSSGKNNAGYYFDYNVGDYLITDLASNPIDTFIGLGCPGAFNGTSEFIRNVQKYPDSVSNLQNNNIAHPDRQDIAKRIIWMGDWIGDFIPRDNPISLNLWSQYVSWIQDESDQQPGKNLAINELHLVYGIGGIDSTGDEQDDGLMTVNDQVAIANNIASNNPDKLHQYKVSHGDLPDEISIKVKIMEELE
ncbi:MAG TPA: S8 family peptidase [Candidatus Nanoarchaeia archaeon]|nr:S8 family peptidase [Candidatus Nanoarchaeia archaeon]